MALPPGEAAENLPDGAWWRFAHAAMHTRFEALIAGETRQYAQQAAQAAFDDVDRLEQQLSRFIPGSDISQLSALKAGQALRVGEAAFECLALACRVWRETDGAFDVTVGPLMDAQRSGLRTADAGATWRSGMGALELDARSYEVRVNGGPLGLDLGAIGKGYAVDRMVAVLREWSVVAALVHGGTSSAYALGAPRGSGGWNVAIGNPRCLAEPLRRVFLRDRSLSGSGIAGDPHIMDPRTARPVEGRLGAWSLAPTAALADALSTAFLVMSADGIAAYCRQHPDCAALRADDGGGAEPQAWNWPELDGPSG